VDPGKKLISLARAKGGMPPKFTGGNLFIHDKIRQEMKSVYLNKSIPAYLDNNARLLFSEAIEYFHTLHLEDIKVVHQGNSLFLFPWLGDRTVNTIAVLLQIHSLKANAYGGIIEISNCTVDNYFSTIKDFIYNTKPGNTQLANSIPDTLIEKFDIYLPKEIRDIGYGEKYFNVDDAWNWLLSTL
jgi:ATP-dependent Lhr-like helicase